MRHTCISSSNLNAGLTVLALLLSPHAVAHQQHDSSVSPSPPNALISRFDIRLSGAVNAMHERCEVVGQRSRLRVTFDSRYRVDFDIHHHTDTATLWPLKLSGVSDYSGEIIADAGIEYCFNFVNKTLRSQTWTFPVSVEMTPLTDATS